MLRRQAAAEQVRAARARAEPVTAARPGRCTAGAQRWAAPPALLLVAAQRAVMPEPAPARVQGPAVVRAARVPLARVPAARAWAVRAALGKAQAVRAASPAARSYLSVTRRR